MGKVVRSLAALLAVLSLTGCTDWALRETSQPELSPTTGQLVFSEPRFAMPANGHVQWLDSPDGNFVREARMDEGMLGDLRISVPVGRETYYVKLRDVSQSDPARRDVLGVTIGPGETVNVAVPVDWVASSRDSTDTSPLQCRYVPAHSDSCTYSAVSTEYYLYYGAGTEWYGTEYLFGPTGVYAKAGEIFTFVQGTQWDVELVLQSGGNLSVDGIEYQSFIES